MERKTHIMRIHYFAWGQHGQSATGALSKIMGKLAQLQKAAVLEPLTSILLLAQMFVHQCTEPSPIKTNLDKKGKVYF